MIVELFYARDEQAIAALSEKYGSVCKQLANNIVKNVADAEECVNDAYLAAWNTIPPEKPDPLRTYLFRIVRNIATAKYHANTSAKRNHYYDMALEELEHSLADVRTVEEALSETELSNLLDRFLDTLERESRVMFVRRYWYSDSIPQIAERFRMSENNVSVRLLRIRNKLKKYLKKEGFER